MKQIQITCNNCSITFNKAHKEYTRQLKKNSKYTFYCCKKCSIEGNTRLDITLKCLECGNEFTSKDDRKFCSKTCSAIYNNKRRDPEVYKKISLSNKGQIPWNRGIEWSQYPLIINCPNCLQNFKAKRASQIYCSNLCSIEFRTKEARKNREPLINYRSLCSFKFNIFHYPDEFDLTLIEEYGIYKAKNRGDNQNGVSRDHILSVKDGFDKGILPYYISHPANCQLMRHKDNVSKHSKSELTIEELCIRIKEWNNKYGAIF